jgi:hypothetical protein
MRIRCRSLRYSAIHNDYFIISKGLEPNILSKEPIHCQMTVRFMLSLVSCMKAELRLRYQCLNLAVMTAIISAHPMY